MHSYAVHADITRWLRAADDCIGIYFHIVIFRSFALSLKILLSLKSDRERFALIALKKIATVSESLLSLFTKE